MGKQRVARLGLASDSQAYKLQQLLTDTGYQQGTRGDVAISPVGQSFGTSTSFIKFCTVNRVEAIGEVVEGAGGPVPGVVLLDGLTSDDLRGDRLACCLEITASAIRLSPAGLRELASAASPPAAERQTTPRVFIDIPYEQGVEAV